MFMSIAHVRRRVVVLAACAVALMFGALMTAGSASAAPSAGPAARSGAVTVAADAVQPLNSKHNCMVAGNSGAIDGVFCADIVDLGGGDYLFQTEAACQDTSTTPLRLCNAQISPTRSRAIQRPRGSSRSATAIGAGMRLPPARPLGGNSPSPSMPRDASRCGLS
jgi:hypothetical protein